MLVPIGIQLILQLLLPALFLFELYRKRYTSRGAWRVKVCVFGLALLFVFLTARWDWTSCFLRVFFPLAFVGAAYVAYRRAGSEPRPPGKPSRTRNVMNGALIVGLLWLNAGVLRGYVAPEGAVDLAYPLKGGVYYVGGGGASRWINNHNALPPQDYALDILRLNPLGNRALGLWPEDLSRYAIYGDTIYSPCTGRVAGAVDGRPDQIPPARDTEHLAGNHVVIACHGAQVLLAHMMQGSLAVQAGDAVSTGDVIGRVGNSGNTSQPHLHIHVERGGPPGEILNGQGVPATFDGRFLVRNSVFTGE